MQRRHCRAFGDGNRTVRMSEALRCRLATTVKPNASGIAVMETPIAGVS